MDQSFIGWSVYLGRKSEKNMHLINLSLSVYILFYLLFLYLLIYEHFYLGYISIDQSAFS